MGAHGGGLGGVRVEGHVEEGLGGACGGARGPGAHRAVAGRVLHGETI